MPAKPHRTNRTPEKDRKFLDLIAGGSTVFDACSAAGYGYSQLYQYRKSDPAFDAAWDDANEAAIQRMEKEADRRSVDGIEKPIYYQGVKVDTIREYSDTLLMFRLKAKRPELYRDRTDVSGTINIQIGLADRLEAARKRTT